MPDVTLPRGYGERELARASRIASELGLAELHVFPPPPPPETDSLGLLRFVGLVVEQLGRRLQR